METRSLHLDQEWPKNGPAMKDPRMYFGFALLIIIAALAVIIALGKVEQASSYGLNEVLICLATLAGGFAQWAFGKKE